MSSKKTLHGLRFSDPLKDATLVALRRAIDPLIELMFDAGITVRELNQLLRECAVRTAVRRVSKESGRDSRSRVAIVTGLPRSEVARILNSSVNSPGKRLGEHPARKVLAGWFDNPRFLSASGDPVILPIFGRRRSFEQLVGLYSGGIPVRAMLDELTQLDAVERLPNQRVRAKSRIPILTGLSSTAIAVIGERTRDLLETLTSNLRRTSKPLFEGTALLEEADVESVALFRREIADQGSNFINSANSLFGRSRAKANRLATKISPTCRLGVTVYYFQDEVDSSAGAKIDAIHTPRKNLQRKRRIGVRKRKVNVSSRHLAES
jgi:Family of unknown function (DUF6502)